MVLPLILAGGAFLGPIALKGLKFATKKAQYYGHKIPYGTAFGQASAFGAGYGAFTNISYNLSDNFLTTGFRPAKTYTPKQINLQSKMPYGQYPRKRRVWSTRYRRYIYVYPRKTYGSRTRTYRSRYRRNYY